MAFELKLPARSKAHRNRMAQDAAEPDFSVEKLIAWCGSNMSKSEMLDLINSLRELAGGAEDDDPAVDPEARRNPTYLKLLGEDRRMRGGSGNVEKAESEFRKMFPDAGRVDRF